MNNYLPKTVKLFLLDGDPAGPKKVQLSNWSGIAFVISRNNMGIINKREELSNQCLYFLIGGSSVSPEVYIGEAENFQRRIIQHQSKDFWNVCVVFLAKDENLSKAHVRFLEAAFVKECLKANRAKLHNGNKPEGAKLPEEDQSEMEEFKNNMKLILSTLGYTFHENATATDKSYEKYFIKAKGLEAKGIYTAEGMIVLEGSKISKEETASIGDSLHDLRSEKLHDNEMQDRDGYYECIKRMIFTSLSMAAGVILGRRANGWIEWKNSDGKTIDEIERKSLKQK